MDGTGRRVVGIIAGVALLFVLGPAALASAATTNKPYSLTIGSAPPTSFEANAGPANNEVASGETVVITATFKNETATQQIGSANLVAPSVFTVVGASVSPSGSASLANNCSVNGATMPACVALRSLSIAPGGSATVTMSVKTPSCQPPGSTYGWASEVKQANNYNGTPGNDFSYDTPSSQPFTAVDGACSLAFVNQPHNEILGNAIDGANDWFTGGTPAGAAVTVEALTSTGAPVPGFNGPVAASLAANPGAGTLTGTSPEDALKGFSDLQISAPANDYKLSASSGTLTSATSSAFNVASTYASCPGSAKSCQTDTTGNNGDGSLTANIVSGSGLLLESANADNGAQLTCSGSMSLDPNTYSFLTTGNLLANKVFTITMLGVKISGSVSKFLQAQQICFGATVAFTPATGTSLQQGLLPDGSTLGYVGLLPPCTSGDGDNDADDRGAGATGPCQAQSSDSATLVGSTYTVKLVADLPSSFPGDPYMR